MNIDEIRQLVQILTESGLSCIEVTQGDTKIRLEREVTIQAASVHVAPAPLPVVAPATQVGSDGERVVDFNRVREIKSPMVGLFYPAPAPGKQPFVSKGSKVSKGDVLCIIEAMKMMNEIIAEEDGTLIDICAQEGQLVEFSQVLFKIF
jgi:acetyl-CoA carboxylase biotin carboxyl carrier protein